MRVQLPSTPRELVRSPEIPYAGRPDQRSRLTSSGAPALSGAAALSGAPALSGAAGAFERTCTELLASERAVQTVIARLRSGRTLSPAQLLEAQVAVYHNLQRVEFLAKCLQSAQSALNTLRQG